MALAEVTRTAFAVSLLLSAEAWAGGVRSGDLRVRMQYGVLDAADAEAAIRDRWADLTRCYKEAGAAKAFAGGSVKLRFLVDAAGGTSDVLVLESAMGNFEVERCLMETGKTLTFPRPEGGATTFEYSLEFRAAGRTPVIDLPASAIQDRVLELLPQLGADCRGVGAREVAATLYIARRGAVRSVGIASRTSVEAEAVACVSRSIRRWKLPIIDAIGSRSLARVTLAIRDSDVKERIRPPLLSRRTTHARRTSRVR